MNEEVIEAVEKEKSEKRSSGSLERCVKKSGRRNDMANDWWLYDENL